MQKFYFLIFSILVAYSAAQAPELGKVYLMRSSMDGAYVRPRSTGEICRGLSGLSGIYFNGPFPSQYQWEISVDEWSGHTILHSLGDGGYRINDLTYEDVAPYCDLDYKILQLIPNAASNAVQIKSVLNNRCLKSLGSEVGIFWSSCETGGIGQYWVFTEITP